MQVTKRLGGWLPVVIEAADWEPTAEEVDDLCLGVAEVWCARRCCDECCFVHFSWQALSFPEPYCSLCADVVSCCPGGGRWCQMPIREAASSPTNPLKATILWTCASVRPTSRRLLHEGWARTCCMERADTGLCCADQGLSLDGQQVPYGELASAVLAIPGVVQTGLLLGPARPTAVLVTSSAVKPELLRR